MHGAPLARGNSYPQRFPLLDTSVRRSAQKKTLQKKKQSCSRETYRCPSTTAYPTSGIHIVKKKEKKRKKEREIEIFEYKTHPTSGVHIFKNLCLSFFFFRIKEKKEIRISEYHNTPYIRQILKSTLYIQKEKEGKTISLYRTPSKLCTLNVPRN